MTKDQSIRKPDSRLEAEMTMKATASLEHSVAEDMEQEDKPLEDVIKNAEAENKKPA